MVKYRKKPVVIEAFQMTEERRYDNSDWTEWLHKAWSKEFGEENSCYPAEKSVANNRASKGKLVIYTLEGEHLVNWDDYIIQGVNGELYPIKKDIFFKTYEEVID